MIVTAGGEEIKIDHVDFWAEAERQWGRNGSASASIEAMGSTFARVVAASSQLLVQRNAPGSRSLWGADFMFDAQTGQPWLLEMQVRNHSFSANGCGQPVAALPRENALTDARLL